MSEDRLLATYLVRVTVRDGRRSIGLHVVGGGGNRRFSSYPDLVEYFEQHEDALGRRPTSDTPAPPCDAATDDVESP